MRKLSLMGALVLLLVAAAAGIVAQNRARSGATTSLAAVPTPTRTPTPRPGSLPSPTPTPRPAPPAPPGPAGGIAIYSIQCSSATPNGVRLTLLWTPSRSGQQWLDLSIFNDNFAPGNFVGAGPFTAQGWSYVWDGLLQGTTHFLRINTLTAAGWMASETFSFYTPVCDQAAYAPAPARDMLALRDRIAAAIAASGIDTAAAITDLRTGETIDVNGARNRLPGCTINLFALLRTTLDLQAGRYPEPAAGDLIARTIYGSNPVTSRELVKDYIGGGDVVRGMQQVNALLQSLGMTSTLMDHPPAYPEESQAGGIDNRITALDVNRGLKALWDGRVLLPGWRDYMLAKMEGVKPGLNYLIPAGVGPGVNVSHKNGFLYSEGWADNDIGIVWFERGGQRYGYAISFFTQGVSTKYADIGLGQRISSLAYQWFAARYAP
ncbi:MAG: serine hydrolase [Dehalococcoidia bacterium]|nr:serine hydrolase [Dehalococcoidia bacterium]